ncbi:potassium channel related protein [Vibrio breoganii]|uniref:ion channel n=1 Tax=Vibrio breoganii TaxID=553239 RepID=UPI000C81DF93|nr:ion channel [Vibrio breoganii]PMM82897.1 potassium channel related protein [Vibrio breoganii]PMO55380.1 potassium channel related protein [Vibrio breoganii]
MILKQRLLIWWDKYLSRYALVLARTNALFLVFAYSTLVYLGYRVLGEHALTDQLVDFIYFLAVTGSTVGYGDMSPSTPNGRLFTAFFVIPLSLGLFGVIIGKVISAFSTFWFRQFKGKHNVNFTNHIVIIGYNRDRTPHLVQMLKREERQRKIVLISAQEQQNPLGDDVEFINAHSFTEEDDLKRASIDKASCLVVDTDTDEMTLTISLFVARLNPNAHLVAHFVDDVKCQILSAHYPNAECISNLSTELLAKSVIDFGSSFIHSELVSAHKGQTQYSIVVPQGVPDFELEKVFLDFKQNFEATIIGSRNSAGEVNINQKLSTVIKSGEILFYIADERVEFSSWPK